MPRCLARQQMVGEYLQKPTTGKKKRKKKERSNTFKCQVLVS
jgi:hypothetical protein